jgi:hypothetical protein
VLNGNVAEHMNLPLDERQMSSRSSWELGRHGNEGRLVIFDRYRVARGLVPLACAVLAREPRQGFEEPRELLGFRCCKSIR